MHDKFAPSVWIRDGHLRVRAINASGEALSYLRAWRGNRSAEFDRALTTMEAAVAGETSAAEARAVFKHFANTEGVLAETDPV